MGRALLPHHTTTCSGNLKGSENGEERSKKKGLAEFLGGVPCFRTVNQKNKQKYWGRGVKYLLGIHAGRVQSKSVDRKKYWHLGENSTRTDGEMGASARRKNFSSDGKRF